MKAQDFFICVVLTQNADMDLISRFVFILGRVTDKFGGLSTKNDLNGVPYITQNIAACFSCKVTNQIDLETHRMFIVKIEVERA